MHLRGIILSARLHASALSDPDFMCILHNCTPENSGGGNFPQIFTLRFVINIEIRSDL